MMAERTAVLNKEIKRGDLCDFCDRSERHSGDYKGSR
jgi:hypothetical protein